MRQLCVALGVIEAGVGRAPAEDRLTEQLHAVRGRRQESSSETHTHTPPPPLQRERSVAPSSRQVRARAYNAIKWGMDGGLNHAVRHGLMAMADGSLERHRLSNE